MQDFVSVTGMILKAEPMGEYDRRVVILTGERGKISAFAKGARRPGNRLMAATNPFSFGTFRLYEGQRSYTVAEAVIRNYFEDLRKDYVGAYYGMYFLEVADYYTRENNEELPMLKLVYQSLRALLHKKLPDELVRCVFELKAIAVNGEYPGPPKNRSCQESTLYALEYIEKAPVEKLYTFLVTPQVLEEMKQIAEDYRKRFMDRKFKSLEIIETLC